MLLATKECLESIKSGSVVSSHCSDARSRVRSLMTAAAAADRLNSGARSVDDELADMDRAIEEAASQIEVSLLCLIGLYKFKVYLILMCTDVEYAILILRSRKRTLCMRNTV